MPRNDGDWVRIEAWGAANPRHYGGLWADQRPTPAGEDRSVTCIGIVADDGPPAPAELLASLDHPEDTATVPVASTCRRLCRLADELAPGAPGGPVLHVRVDVSANRVRVSVGRGHDQIADFLLDRYGEELLTVERGCTPARLL